MTKKISESRKVLLLRDCWAGACGQVISLPDDEATRAVAHGDADDHPDAVAAHEG